MEEKPAIGSRPPPLLARDVRTFASNVGAIGALQVLMRLQGLILLPLITRSFGPAGYGIWTQFFVSTELVSRLVGLSLDESLARFAAGTRSRDEQREHFYATMWMFVGVNVVAAGILLLFPVGVAQILFGGPEFAPYVRLMAPYLILEAFDALALNMLRALHRLKLYAFLEASQAVTRIGIVALALLFVEEILVAIAIYMAVQVLWLAAELFIIYRLIGFRRPTFQYTRESLAYALPLIPTQYANLVLAYSDRLLIAHFFGPAAVGFYAASYDFSKLIWHVMLPFRLTLTPVISRLWDEGRTLEVSNYLSKTLKYSLLAGIPAAVGLGLLAPPFLAVVSSSEFAAVGRVVVPIATLGILLNNVAGVFAVILRLHKKTRLVALAIVSSAALHFALNLIFIPVYGLVGGAIATLAGYAFELVFTFGLSWPRLRFPLPVRPVSVAIVAAGLMAPVVMWMSQWGGWLAVLGAIGAGGIIYGLAIFLLGAVTWREVQVVLGRQGA